MRPLVERRLSTQTPYDEISKIYLSISSMARTYLVVGWGLPSIGVLDLSIWLLTTFVIRQFILLQDR